MQNTKLVVVQGKNLLEALNQADALMKSVFKEINCQVQNMFVVPEATQTQFQQRPTIVCNVVMVMVAADGVEWPESNVPEISDQVQGMKAIKE
jgi:hypothetical protein